MKSAFNTSILFVLFLWTSSCFAQKDSSFIAPYSHPFSLNTYVTNTLFNISHQDQLGNQVQYVSNNPYGIGLGFSWKSLSLSGSYAFDFMRDPEKGKTKSLGLQVHFYRPKAILDVFIHRFQGFYSIVDEEAALYNLHPDMKINLYGFHGEYLFNHKKFSSRAAFSQSEIQLKSAGSFKLGGGIYYSLIKGDTSILTNSADLRTNFQLGINGGYMHSWYLGNYFLLSGSISFGLHAGKENINPHWLIYPSVFPRFSFGYNREGWSLAFTFVYNQVFVNITDHSSIILNTGNLALTFTKRFHKSPPFLRRFEHPDSNKISFLDDIFTFIKGLIPL